MSYSMITVNPQIVDAVIETNKAVIGPGPQIPADTSVAKHTGNGIAYQYVAQSCAMGVQDGENYMRNIMAMAEAATAVVMTNMLKNPPASIGQWSPALTPIQTAVTNAINSFKAAGIASAEILNQYPAS